MNLTSQIKSVLNQNTLARDSDQELIIQVLLKRGIEFTFRQLQIVRELNFESVRRTRQRLQATGKFLPSPEVAEQRKKKAKAVRQNIVNATPEETEKMISRQPLEWGQG